MNWKLFYPELIAIGIAAIISWRAVLAVMAFAALVLVCAVIREIADICQERKP